MTFQDNETYDRYTKCLSNGSGLVMDPSELPGQAGEVRFWTAWGSSNLPEYFAIGKVMIGDGS